MSGRVANIFVVRRCLEGCLDSMTSEIHFANIWVIAIEGSSAGSISSKDDVRVIFMPFNAVCFVCLLNLKVISLMRWSRKGISMDHMKYPQQSYFAYFNGAAISGIQKY